MVRPPQNFETERRVYVELLLRHNNKKLIAHVNRLKLYFVQSPAAVSSSDFFPAQKECQHKKKQNLKFFSPTMTNSWTGKSTILTLPLQLNNSLAIARVVIEQCLLHHLPMVICQRPHVLTLPLCIS